MQTPGADGPAYLGVVDELAKTDGLLSTLLAWRTCQMDEWDYMRTFLFSYALSLSFSLSLSRFVCGVFGDKTTTIKYIHIIWSRERERITYTLLIEVETGDCSDCS